MTPTRTGRRRRGLFRVGGLLAVAGLFALASIDAWADDRPTTPGVAPATAAINEMVSQGWLDFGIKASPVANDPEYLRRTYLDLLGRIPTLEETTSFLASTDPEKRAKLIDQLLDHPDYAKNFSTIWTNLLVGRRPEGRRVNRPALAAWLRRQFGENRPWDETARALIDSQGSNKDNGAVNFALAHSGDGAINLTSFTTRLFLGQQIQCTQCHDHPSNDWKQADFWGINAFFKGIRSRDEMRVDATGAEVYDYTVVEDEPTDAYASFETRTAMIGIAFPTYLDGRKISQGTDVDRRAELARFITAEDSQQFARAFVNRMWGHLLGRGFVQPVDDFGDHNEASHPELLDRLAEEFEASGYDVKALVRWITASEPYSLTSMRTRENEKDESLFSHVLMKPMTPEQLFDSLLVATAAHKVGGNDETDRRRDAWMRQFIFTFANDEGEEGNLFQGTIPQALMMMNGELIARATSGARGSLIAQLKDKILASRSSRPQVAMIQGLYLAALSRPPTPRELDQASRLIAASPDGMEALEDLFWALLNSNEFILNH